MGSFLKLGKKTVQLPIEEEYTETVDKAAPGSLTEEPKKVSRFYLPVLSINDKNQWPSKDESERQRFTDEVAYQTCLGNCCGVPGLKGACCQLDPEDLEHVLGPVTDYDIERIMAVLKKGRMKPVTREDVVIDFEEGKIMGEKFFNNHPVFADPKSYPILRMQVLGVRFACKFLNTKSMKCSIYESRPNMCRGYYCEYIKGNFLIKINGTYKKVR